MKDLLWLTVQEYWLFRWRSQDDSSSRKLITLEPVRKQNAKNAAT